MRFFISYRRSDVRPWAGRLSDRLVDEFGVENVFFDVDSILPGMDFREVIKETIERTDVVLMLIGDQWDVDKLHGDNDFVRMELEEALQQRRYVVPVLVGQHAEMPTPSDLPASVGQLSYLNAIRLRPDPDFRSDTARLIETVTRGWERREQRRAEQTQAEHARPIAAARRTDDTGLETNGTRPAAQNEREFEATPATQPTLSGPLLAGGEPRKPPATQTTNRSPARRRHTVLAVIGGLIALAGIVTAVVVRSNVGDDDATPLDSNWYGRPADEVIEELDVQQFSVNTIPVCSGSVGAGEVRQILGPDGTVYLDEDGVTEAGLNPEPGSALTVKVGNGEAC
jgi:hypothetical protein